MNINQSDTKPKQLTWKFFNLKCHLFIHVKHIEMWTSSWFKFNYLLSEPKKKKKQILIALQNF